MERRYDDPKADFETIDTLDATAQLTLRPSREPNYKDEAQVLVDLAASLAESSESVLQKVADAALRISGAGSAGISMLEQRDGQDIFRWRGMSGQLREFVDNYVLRDSSPCALSLDSNKPTLLHKPARRYAYIADLDFPVFELLLIPFRKNDVPIGTIWLCSHIADKKFDAEDVRSITSLAHFAVASIEAMNQRRNVGAAELSTEKMRSQLVDETQKLEAIFQDSPAAMALWRGQDLVFERLNPEYQKIFGSRALLGRALEDAVPELKGQPFPELLRQVLRTGKPYHGREEMALIPQPDGGLEEHFYDYTYYCINDHKGEPYGVFDHAIDVTQRILDRRRIEESEASLSLALTAGQIGFWDWNAKTGHTVLSETLMADWGIDKETYNNTLSECLAYILDEDRERVWDEIQTAVFNRNTYDLEYRVRRKNGEIIWVNAKGQYFVDANGEPERLTGITINITDRKRAAEELRAAKEEAEKANQLKSVFLANMSHEIRTPLGAMIGFADLLRDPNLSKDERHSFIDILARNGEQLSLLINDILDLSKVEAGHLSLEFTETHPKTLAADVIALFAMKAIEKGLSLTYEPADSTPDSIISDPTRVRQILLNLVGNAVKFTTKGSVTVRSHGRVGADGLNHLCFEVIDTGIGIAKSHHERVFEMFVQADGTTTRHFGGTGLGLALSRRLARALGGEVSISDSEENVGTRFLICVSDQPLRRDAEFVEPEPLPKASAPMGQNLLRNVRVLVVDDSPDNQELIGRFLMNQGAEVGFADNGLEGLKAALEGRYDIVLMDVQMPVMDGYTATEKLRQAGFVKPIIVLTAHAMAEVRRKVINAGCTDFLPKPLNARDLVNLVARYTRGEGSPKGSH